MPEKFSNFSPSAINFPLKYTHYEYIVVFVYRVQGRIGENGRVIYP